MIFYCFHFEKLVSSAVWRTWAYREARVEERDQTKVIIRIHMNDGGSGLGARVGDDSSGISEVGVNRILDGTGCGYL